MRVGDQEDAKDLIDRIHDAQRHLLRLYEGVREYAAPINIHREPCDLGRILDDVWEEIAAEREGRAVELYVEESLVDLHCHVLPGVDDGSPDVETSLAMLSAAAAAGTSVMIATPHQHPTRYPNRPEPLRAALRLLNEARDAAVAGGATLPELHLGAEVHLDEGLIDRLGSGELFTLAGGRYVLLELPDVFPTQSVERLLYELQVAGYVPLLAHPERIGRLAREPRLVERFVALGALTQVTAHSVSGRFGPECRALTHRLLKAGLVHVVASDAHDLVRRPTPLAAAREAVVEAYGEAEAQRLFEEGPRAILEGRDLVPPEPRPLEEEARPSLLSRLFGRGGRG